MTAVAALSTFVAEAAPPEHIIPIIRDAVADCFGCILAGADSEVIERVHGGIAVLSKGTVPLFGSDHRYTAGYAALMNAVSGHAYDLDDWEEPGNTHPTVVMFPAMLAAAHLQPVSGSQMMTAYAVGFEVIARLGEMVSLNHYARGFHSTATLGAIGAAAAVSRLFDLTTEETAHALGIAVSQAVGYTAQFGSNTKPLQAGFAARTGLEAALMAANGVTSRPDTITHKRGFAGLMGRYSDAKLDTLSSKLGNPWVLEEYGLILKPWPSCGYTHRLMTAALEMRSSLLDRFDAIAKIEAVQPDFHNAILPFDNPTSRNEALFSAPACIAKTLVTGNLTLADSAKGFWEAEPVARLIQVTEVMAEEARKPELNYDPEQPDILTVTMADGERLETQCAYPLGAPQNPMNETQLAAKYCSITGRDEAGFSQLLDWTSTTDVAAFFKEVAKS